MKSNLILLGFMGSGKTSTGRILSQKMGYRFLDTDQQIEQETGLPVHELFKLRGEKAFRSLEGAVLEKALAGEGQVLATGGGMWMNEDNRRRLLGSGWCVWLKVGASQAWERVRADLGVRPLLAAAEDPLAKVAELLKMRDPLYALAPHQVETDGLKPADVAERILRQLKESGPFDLPPLP